MYRRYLLIAVLGTSGGWLLAYALAFSISADNSVLQDIPIMQMDGSFQAAFHQLPLATRWLVYEAQLLLSLQRAVDYLFWLGPAIGALACGFFALFRLSRKSLRAARAIGAISGFILSLVISFIGGTVCVLSSEKACRGNDIFSILRLACATGFYAIGMLFLFVPPLFVTLGLVFSRKLFYRVESKQELSANQG